MIWRIVRKELLVNLLSARFAAGVAIAGALAGRGLHLRSGGGDRRGIGQAERFVENAVWVRQQLFAAVLEADQEDPGNPIQARRRWRTARASSSSTGTVASQEMQASVMLCP